MLSYWVFVIGIEFIGFTFTHDYVLFFEYKIPDLNININYSYKHFVKLPDFISSNFYFYFYSVAGVKLSNKFPIFILIPFDFISLFWENYTFCKLKYVCNVFVINMLLIHCNIIRTGSWKFLPLDSYLCFIHRFMFFCCFFFTQYKNI